MSGYFISQVEALDAEPPKRTVFDHVVLRVHDPADATSAFPGASERQLVWELRSFGSEAEFVEADIRKEEDVRVLVDATVARFGRLDASFITGHVPNVDGGHSAN